MSLIRSGSLWSWVQIGTAVACASGVLMDAQSKSQNGVQGDGSIQVDTSPQLETAAPAKLVAPNAQPLNPESPPSLAVEASSNSPIRRVAFLATTSANQNSVVEAVEVTVVSQDKLTNATLVSADRPASDPTYVDGRFRDGVIHAEFQLQVQGTPAGELHLKHGARTIGSTRVSPQDQRPLKLDVEIDRLAGRNDPQPLTWRFVPVAGEPQAGGIIKSLEVDFEGPELLGSPVATQHATETQVTVFFRDDDLDPTSATKSTHYRAYKVTDGAGKPIKDFTAALHPEDKNKVVLTFESKLEDGLYALRIPTAGDTSTATSLGDGTNGIDGTRAATSLRDQAGNVVGGVGIKGRTLEAYFSVEPEPAAGKGKHVEFPEFLPTAPQPVPRRRINAGDKVETRVIRLFYFRDAHRVAQLINRTAKTLNQQAVTLAERRAADARELADDYTDDRRALERKAVRAAEDVRRAQNELEQLQRSAAEADKQLDRVTNEIARLQDDRNKKLEERERIIQQYPGHFEEAPVTENGEQTDASPEEPIAESESAEEEQGNGEPIEEDQTNGEPPAEVKQKVEQLDARLKQLASQLETLEQHRERASTVYTNAVQNISTVRNSIDDLRRRAAQANEDALAAQAKEDRQRESQFRLEVAAAHEEPDTYAAAQKHSVDPVAQCSVSVIGEGLLQVRGPRKGIDKIRTMVDQIDMPLGQVKVEVVTVQINGERGERMERPLGRVEAQINLGRFLTSQSLMMLRQAIVAEATIVAEQVDTGGHYQVDRDRKYLYAFFGRDFIDELYEMDSEFLRSENKILSLHSMDTVGLHQALFVLALARNDVRQRILARFMDKVRSHLVQAEFDFRRSSELKPHKTWHWLPHHSRAHREEKFYEAVCLNNQQRYHFRNLLTFFGQMQGQLGGTMNPMQREFIRLAQIFKSRLVAEIELKQRVIERTMIEDDRELDLQAEEAAERVIRTRLLTYTEMLQDVRFEATESLGDSITAARQIFTGSLADADALRALVPQAQERANRALRDFDRKRFQVLETSKSLTTSNEEDQNSQKTQASSKEKAEVQSAIEASSDLLKEMNRQWKIIQTLYPRIRDRSTRLRKIESELENCQNIIGQQTVASARSRKDIVNVYGALARSQDCVSAFYTELESAAELASDYYRDIEHAFNVFYEAATPATFIMERVSTQRSALLKLLAVYPKEEDRESLVEQVRAINTSATDLDAALRKRKDAQGFLVETRRSLGQRKLLDFLIEEQEQKVADLREGTRAHLARMDDYLKRMMIALEDDFNIQFYDPAFVRIRSAAREWDVTLGQVERTSILTNNRAFAKVTPQATMEFDLPKRKVAIVEAFDAAQALVQDYGAMMNDPTFLAAAQLMGAGPPNGLVRKVYPSTPNSREEQQMQYSDQSPEETGSALQDLVPDPSIYKFETGTGYEIRPVIQPDGYSIVYDFNYMYTTNVREPVQADEKHLGRVKRHFVDTQVQTGSFEMREVSRYQVALKAARTSQGVPLLQDIPVVGLAFRPLPSAESSIQQNVILARSVVYPTVFDVMGLRWAPSVVDLSHEALRDHEHVARGRHRTVTDAVYDETSRRVDTMLGIGVDDDADERHRPDLYRRQRRPSPYHPGGYMYPEMSPGDDPTGEGFEHEDNRPPEMRQPPYNPRFRRPIRFEQVPALPQSIHEQSLDATGATEQHDVFFDQQEAAFSTTRPTAQPSPEPPHLNAPQGIQ